MENPDCIFCGKEMELNDVYLCHLKDYDKKKPGEEIDITHFQCMDCAEDHRDDRPLKDSSKWGFVKATLDGIILM